MAGRTSPHVTKAAREDRQDLNERVVDRAGGADWHKIFPKSMICNDARHACVPSCVPKCTKLCAKGESSKLVGWVAFGVALHLAVIGLQRFV